METSFEVMERRVLKRIAKEILDLNEHRGTQDELLQALRYNDEETLKYFLSFETIQGVRGMIMNVHEYRCAMNYGFFDKRYEVSYDEYGWIIVPEWPTLEVVSLRHKKDKAMSNEITLACGPNGKWTYGLHYGYGAGSGGGWYPSVFDRAYDSRQACLITAAKDLLKRQEETVARAIERPDGSNFNVPYMNKIIAQVKELLPKEQPQLQLF